MRLDVHVMRRRVASLYRERDEYVLRYLDDARPEDFVSLAMPVREAPWRWPRDLHPFFRQNLPEGFLLNLIREQFGPLLDGTDLSLLAVVGAMGIGRVTVTPEGVAPGTALQGLDVQRILHGDNTEAHFAALVREYARAAISGAVPKFIAPDPDPDPGTEDAVPLGKPTLRTSRYIVKGSDDSTPFLGFNEFYSMRVLERLKVVPVAATQMSDDGRALVVERFDVDAQGVPVYGVEDMCGLLGLPPHEKYAATTEKVLAAARAYLSRSALQQHMEHLAWHLLVNYVVRNADCHAKNIALTYHGADDVAFSPVYDIVTTQAYPRFANNPPGLFIDGRKTWAAGKTLERLLSTRMGIAPRRYAAMVEALCDSAVAVGHELIAASRQEPQWRDVAKQMLHAWNDGMESLRSARKNAGLRALTPAIEEAGFSDAAPADKAGTVIGRSSLLGSRGTR